MKKIIFFLILVAVIAPMQVRPGEVAKLEWDMKELLSPPPISDDLVKDLNQPSDEDKQRSADHEAAAIKKTTSSRRKIVAEKSEPTGCQSGRIQVREGSVIGIDDGGLMTMCEVLPSARLLQASWGEVVAGGQTTTIETVPDIPASPTPLTPANASLLTPGRVGFTWTGASGMSSYRIQVSTNSSFAQPIIDADTTSASYKTNTALAPNTYFWRVNATDASNKSSEWSPASSMIVDVAPPSNATAAKFINNGAVSTNSAAVSLSITAADSSGIAAYFISESPVRPESGASSWVPVTPTKTYTSSIPFTLSSDDGTKTVYVWFKNSVGRVSKAAHDTIILDTTPPETAITGGPANPVNSTSAVFNFNATEAGSTFQCSLDDGAYAACASPKSYAGLAEGLHSIDIKATDAAGNIDPTPARYTWTIDVTPPDTAITLQPATPTNSTSADFSFTATKAGSTFQCSFDDKPYTACASPLSYTGLTEGSHTLAVKATDAAGNIDPTPARYAWTVDIAPPETAITERPATPTNATSIEFSFASTEAGSTFECSLDNGVFAPCTGPRLYTALAEGRHSFDVRATDAAGNIDPTPARWVWTIDTTPPHTAITIQPANLTNSTSADFSFTSTEDGSTFQCSLDDGAYAACASPLSYAGLAEGSHTLAVKATDAAGNADPTPARYAWAIDATPPETVMTIQPANLTNSTSANFSFSSTEPDSTFECQLDGYASETCTSPLSYTGLAEGSHTLTVKATDAAGNADPTPARYTWNIDITPPDTSITGKPSNPANSTSAEFNFAATKAGATFQCSLDDGLYTACTSPQSYIGLSPGNHTLAVKATDAVGNTDETPASFAWVVNPPPINATQPSFINKGGSYFTHDSVVKLSIAATASSEKGVVAYYASENPVTPNASNPGWVTFSDKKDYSRAVDFTLSAGNGKKTVYIWFKDSSDNISDVKSDTIYFFQSERVLLVFLLLQLVTIL